MSDTPLKPHFSRLRELTEELETKGSRRQKVVEFMNHSPAICFIKSGESGRYEFVNPAFCLAIQKREEEVIGKSDYELFNVETAKSLVGHDMQVLKEEKSICTFESLPSDGTQKVYLVMKFIIINGAKSLGGVAIPTPEAMQVDLHNLSYTKEVMEGKKEV